MVTIYTDGSFNPQLNVGGWAAIVIKNGEEKEYSGNTEDSYGYGQSMFYGTSAQRMEIVAVLEGLLTLDKPSNVEVISDSQYVVDTMEKGWLNKWMRENDTEKIHLDLWRTIFTLSKLHNLKFTWVKGHSGNHYNERCDTLAQIETRKTMSLIDIANEHKAEKISNSLSDNLDLNNSSTQVKKDKHQEVLDEDKQETLKDIAEKKNKPKKRRRKSNKKKQWYYAVAKGRKVGIYKDWHSCQKQVNKFRGGIFKKFDNEEDAKDFIELNK